MVAQHVARSGRTPAGQHARRRNRWLNFPAERTHFSANGRPGSDQRSKAVRESCIRRSETFVRRHVGSVPINSADALPRIRMPSDLTHWLDDDVILDACLDGIAGVLSL